jgi:cytidyltransferase-like protein
MQLEQPSVIVSGPFDDLKSADLLFLHSAAQLGLVTVLLWPDEMVCDRTGALPKFPLAERDYLLRAIRFVHTVVPLPRDCDPDSPGLPEFVTPDCWADLPGYPSAAQRVEFCCRLGIDYLPLRLPPKGEFPDLSPMPRRPTEKKVVVTGCYDWFHSGHVRFFEEVSKYGDLYVVVGHDANIRLLKGHGHPLLPQQERRFMVASVRFVTQALISSGEGWLDADPEIQRIRPDLYAVNEDGDKGGKREYCAAHGIEYLILKRAPAPGLPARSSTDLRGF